MRVLFAVHTKSSQRSLIPQIKADRRDQKPIFAQTFANKVKKVNLCVEELSE